MSTKTFEELTSGANKIRTNELPESNTHALVGDLLLKMVLKMANIVASVQGNTNKSVEGVDLELDIERRRINDLIITCVDRRDILMFSGFESMYNYGVKENIIIGTGNGTVYYDETEKVFFKAIDGTCYLNWDGDFPSSLYSHDNTSFRVDKIYIDCSNTLLYAGTNDGSYIAINQTLSTTGRSTRFPMSQKAATDAINAVASKVIDARDVLPFGGFAKIADFSGTTSNSEGTGEGEVYYDKTQYSFYKIIGNTLYLNWAGDYPSSVYTLDGNSFRTDKIYSDSDNRKTYTGMSDGSYIEISSPISIYQTTGTSTSGTMSQSAITKLFDSLAGSVFIELGTLGVDFESLDTIKTKGAYTYKVNGRVTPGKPVVVYNYILFVIDTRQIQFGESGIITRTLGTDNIWSEWTSYGGASGELPIDINWVNPTNDKAPSTYLVHDRFNTIGNIIENFQKTIQTYADYEAIIEESAWGPHGIEPINPNNWVRLYREGVLVGHLIDGSECFINITSANANGYFLEGWYKPVDDPDNYIPINAQVVLGEEYVTGTSGEKCLRVTMSSNETNRAEAIDALNNCRVKPGISTYKQYTDIVAKRQFGDYSIEGDCELYDADGNLLGIFGDGGDSYVTINSATSNGVKVTGIYRHEKSWLPIDTVCYPDMHADGRLFFRLQEDFGNYPMDIKNLKTSIGVLASLKTTAKNIVGAVNELFDKMGTVKKVKINGLEKTPDAQGLVDLGNIGGDGTGGGLTEEQQAFIGQPVDLQTEAKNSLPSAINEVADKVESLGQEMGNISTALDLINGEVI